MSNPTPGKNTDPSPMTYEIQHFPSLAQQRAVLAVDADAMNAADLREAAGELLIDTGGAKSKQDLVDAVRDGARTVIPASESTTTKPKKG